MTPVKARSRHRSKQSRRMRGFGPAIQTLHSANATSRLTMLARTLLLLALIFPAARFAQNPFSGIEPGMAADQFGGSAKDVSNPQSWDETAFEVDNPHSFVITRGRNSRRSTRISWCSARPQKTGIGKTVSDRLCGMANFATATL